MEIELRVCQHCFDGDHGNEHKTAVVRDMVACAQQIQEYKDVIGLEAVHIRKVTEDEPGAPEALPAVAATLQNDQVTIPDVQLVTKGQDGTMLVYPNPNDALTVLSRNVDEISKGVDEDVSVELSPEGAELLS